MIQLDNKDPLESMDASGKTIKDTSLVNMITMEDEKRLSTASKELDVCEVYAQVSQSVSDVCI